jgi:hypothetical protein
MTAGKAPPDNQVVTNPEPLVANWTVTEADIAAATRGVPGSIVDLLRWPIAFFIAYVGVGLSQPGPGAAFTLGSASVVVVFWVIVALAMRGTAVRKAAKTSEATRNLKLSIAANVIRNESADGHAAEFPFAELKNARWLPQGLLVLLGGNVFLIPTRAMERADRWHEAVASVEPRRWPTRRLAWTFGLWAFALLVVAYGFFNK